MEADPYSYQRRDPVLGPMRGEQQQTAEAIIKKTGARGVTARQPPSDAQATPHQLKMQGQPLRRDRISGL